MAPRQGINKHLMGMVPVIVAMVLATGPAAADWRQDLGTFRVGFAAAGGVPVPVDRYEAFRKAVAETLGMPVEIVPERDAPALIDAVASARVEYAVLSALGYATAREMCGCVEPVAAPVNTDGATAFRSILLARAGEAERAADLDGKKVGIGPAGSVAGDMLPASLFRFDGKSLGGSGLDLVRIETARDGLDRLASGEIAALFTWEFVRPGTARDFVEGPSRYLAQQGSGDVTVLWRSPPVRFGPHVVRKGLPPEARSALRRMLLSLDRESPEAFDSVSPSFGGGFEPVDDNDYRSATALVGAVSRVAPLPEGASRSSR